MFLCARVRRATAHYQVYGCDFRARARVGNTTLTFGMNLSFVLNTYMGNMFVSARARVRQATEHYKVYGCYFRARARVGNTTLTFGIHLSLVLNTYRGTCLFLRARVPDKQHNTIKCMVVISERARARWKHNTDIWNEFKLCFEYL